MYILLKERSVFKITGEDRIKFLQGLLSNDISKVNDQNPIYACMLTPQGKFFADFFLISKNKEIIFDISASNSTDIINKLNIYKLRSKINISNCIDYCVVSLINERNNFNENDSIIYKDPRSTSMGKRGYIYIDKIKELKNDSTESTDEYDKIRIHNFIPEGHKDLIPNKSFPFEYDLDMLNAIDYNKGCYVGQELVARTHYRGQVRKQVVQIIAKEKLPPLGTEIFIDKQKIGIVCSSVENIGIALVKTEDVLKYNKENKITTNNLEIEIIFKEQKSD